MPRTYSDLQLEALTDEFSTTKYLALMKTWINEGAQKLSREIQLPQLEASTTFTQSAGVQTYAMATTVQVITSLVDTVTNSRLAQVGIEDIDDYGTSTGIPEAFAIYASSIHFAPIPSSSRTYRLRHESGLADLTTTADAADLDFPSDFLDLLVHYARMRAFANEDDFEGAAYHEGQWDKGVARMRHQTQLRSRGRANQIQGNMVTSNRPRFRRP